MTSNVQIDLEALRTLVARLRAPDGCPWDREQQLPDVRAYLIEEAHEAAEALDQAVQGDGFSPLAEELGDLLFQIVFIAELARETGAFDLATVIAGIHQKMVDRHPHVFGEDERLGDSTEVLRRWELRKAEQRRKRGDAGDASVLAGVPRGVPALVGSLRLGQKAAGVGFDWPDASGALDKVREELGEVTEALEAGDASAAREEIGDLLFAVASVARKIGVDPEAALASANGKFRRRFAGVESSMRAEGIALRDADLDTLESAWQAVKRAERAADPA